MIRAIFVSVIVAMTAFSAGAEWKCLSVCHYYLPNSSPTHPSLPDQAHESHVESFGVTLEDAYYQLEQICLELGFEGHLAGNANQSCWEYQ